MVFMTESLAKGGPHIRFTFLINGDKGRKSIPLHGGHGIRSRLTLNGISYMKIYKNN